MRAPSSIKITRDPRYGRLWVIALALGICALTIPANVSAYSDYPTGDPSIGLPEGDTTHDGGGPVVSGAPVDAFDWGDAALGAGAAMALFTLGAAGLTTVRRRATPSPSASTT